MHDGAPAHFDHVVRDHLNERFHQWWIGRGVLATQITRPHFIRFLNLWDYLNTVVYATPVNHIENLWERVQNACQVIRDDNLVFGRIRQSCVRRVQAFV
jgi:hypothetical protein